jgi:hypothetical protein
VPLLQVRSPGNNTFVPSLLWIRVNATSTAGITGIIVYIDGVRTFTTAAAYVDKTFPVGAGTHFVTVRSWNSKGEFSTYEAKIAVPLALLAPAPVIAPTNQYPATLDHVLVADLHSDNAPEIIGLDYNSNSLVAMLKPGQRNLWSAKLLRSRRSTERNRGRRFQRRWQTYMLPD